MKLARLRTELRKRKIRAENNYFARDCLSLPLLLILLLAEIRAKFLYMNNRTPMNHIMTLSRSRRNVMAIFCIGIIYQLSRKLERKSTLRKNIGHENRTLRVRANCITDTLRAFSKNISNNQFFHFRLHSHSDYSATLGRKSIISDRLVLAITTQLHRPNGSTATSISFLAWLSPSD